MKKWQCVDKTIKADNGDTKDFKVLQKWRKTNITDENGKTHYNVYEPMEIWFAPEEKDDIIEALNMF